MRAHLLVPLLVLALSGCFRGTQPPSSTLPRVADALVEAVEGEGGLVSVYVVDAASGQPLYAHRPHVRLLPASTMKVVSTAAALSALGPTFRFHTPVRLEGRQVGTLFEGNLVASPSGDPSLGSWRFPETATACDTVAEALWLRGIRQWRGQVLVREAEPWLDGPLGPGWAWDDAAYAYSAPPTSFVFRENVVDLSLSRPESADCSAVPQVRLMPALDALATEVLLDTQAERAGFSCVHRGGRVRCVWRSVEGECPRAAGMRLAVDQPQALFASCVEEALERRGIARLAGRLSLEPRVAPLPPPAPLLEGGQVELVSPPLSELVKATNKESLNLYAERLGMAFARERTGREGFAALQAALGEELARRDISPRDVRPVDGSGLSRYNQASARGLVQVLHTSLGEPYGSTLVDSLPVAGVDGTLRSRGRHPEVQGRVRAKTGSFSGQKAFVGVAERPGDAAHPRVVFALLLGNMAEGTALPPNEAFDRLAEALVTLPLR